MASDKKKFVIKPFRPRNHMDTAAAQTIWQALARAIDEIHQKNASSLSFEELYRNAYNLVLHKHGELLYKGVHDAVEDHLTKGAEVVAAAPDERLLAALNVRWQDHGLTMVMVRRCCGLAGLLLYAWEARQSEKVIQLMLVLL